MRADDLVRALGDSTSGVRILEAAADVARFHRVPGSRGYEDAADVVVHRLETAGVAATVHRYPADGRSQTYSWVSPPAWDVKSGVLREVVPAERKLADFDEVAQAVVVHSPGGTFEGEVIDIGSPTRESDYDALDLAGRVVLSSARASEVVPRAARRGAVGVVVYPESEKAAASHDMVSYQSLFPTAEEIPQLVPAFSVSRRVADGLVGELRRGPVTLRGEVDAAFRSGSLAVVEATVRGTDPGRGSILLLAHLCHPRGSANDNASGAGALIELARTLRLRSPAVDVRLLWMPEFYGSLPWAAERASALRDVDFVLNLDMVGASPERIGEPLHVFRAPNHTPHYVNALVEPLLARISALPATVSTHGSTRPLHWAFDIPSGGSDHVVFAADPHRLPALMLGHEDPFWHTDFDTPDKLDPTRLKQVAVLVGAMVTLARSPEHAATLGEWLLAYGVRELTRAAALTREATPEDGTRLLDVALGVEVARVETADTLGAHRARIVDVLQRVRAALGETPGKRPASRAATTRPLRQMDGPLPYSITEEWSDDERAFFKERLSANHRALAEGLLNHCDGSKTPSDIALYLSLDAGRIVAVEDVERGLELLRKTGYIA